MFYRLLADSVLVTHLLFIVFVVFGGVLVFVWPRVRLVHLPTVAYGALIEWVGWVCPLTPLENYFRGLAGQAGYTGGFIEHYLVPIIYPAGYTMALRIALGAAVLLINLAVYAVYYRGREAE